MMNSAAVAERSSESSDSLITLGRFKEFEAILDYRQWGGGPLELILRGVPIKIPPQSEDKPAWHRLHLTLKGSALNVTLDDQAVIQNQELPRDPPETTLGLNPSGPTDFANLYLRPLP